MKGRRRATKAELDTAFETTDWLRLDHLKATGMPIHIDAGNGDTELRIACRTIGDNILPDAVCCTAPLLNRHGTYQFMVRDRRIDPMPTWLEITRQRFKCKTCGKTCSEVLPDVDDDYEMTKRLKHDIAMSAINRPYKDAATFHAVEETTVKRVFTQFARQKLASYEIELPRVFGVDENKLGEDFRFICADVEKGQILDMLTTRKLEVLDEYFGKLDSPTNVQVFVMDMWEPYKIIAQKHFPSATVVIDKFHVVRYANKAFVEARKAYQNTLPKKSAKTIKSNHRVFLKRWEKLSDKGKDRLDRLITEHPALGEAYILKEHFFDLYNVDTRAEAEAAYDHWTRIVPLDLHPFFHELFVMMRNWRTEIFNYFDARYTNAGVENLNRKVNEINAIGRGLEFENLRAKAILKHGTLVPAGSLRFYSVRSKDGRQLTEEETWSYIRRPLCVGIDVDAVLSDLKAGTF